MLDQIPDNLKGRILFLPQGEWAEPEGFREISTMDRRAMMKRFKNLSQEPTEENHWVWFGEYRSPTFAATCGSQYVLRELYNIFVEPLGKKRLTNNTGKWFSDVNPFLARPAANLRNVPTGALRRLDLRKQSNKQLFAHSTPTPSVVKTPKLPEPDNTEDLFDANKRIDISTLDPQMLKDCVEELKYRHIPKGKLFLEMAIGALSEENDDYPREYVEAAYYIVHPD